MAVKLHVELTATSCNTNKGSFCESLKTPQVRQSAHWQMFCRAKPAINQLFISVQSCLHFSTPS